MKSNKKPTEAGWYAWWENKKDKNPYCVLAVIKIVDDVVMVNFEYEKDPFDYVALSGVAERYWMRIDT